MILNMDGSVSFHLNENVNSEYKKVCYRMSRNLPETSTIFKLPITFRNILTLIMSFIPVVKIPQEYSSQESMR